MWMLLVGGLRRRWVEHALTALVIAAAVAGLAALRAISAAAEAEVHELAHRLGRNMLVLPAGVEPADFYAQRFQGGLPQDTPDRIRASPAGEHVQSLQARLYGTARVGGQEVTVVGEDLGWSPLPDGREPVIAGTAAARALGVGPGGEVWVSGSRLAILEVKDDPADGLDTALLMQLGAAQRVLGRSGELSAIRLAGCWCRVDVRELARQVEAAAPGTRAVTIAGLLDAQKGTIDVARRYGTTLHGVAAAGVVALVAALVRSGARRRARELGLLAAIGAPPDALARLLVAEAALVGAAGGILGGVLSLPAARALAGAQATLPAAPGVAVAFAAGALCAAASWLPAHAAATRDPAVALRETPP